MPRHRPRLPSHTSTVLNTRRPHKNNLKRRTRHWKRPRSLPTKGLRDPMDVVRRSDEVIVHTHCTGYQIITSLRGEVAPGPPLRPTPLYACCYLNSHRTESRGNYTLSSTSLQSCFSTSKCHEFPAIQAFTMK